MRCFFCLRNLTAERAAMSNACVACGTRELERIYPQTTSEIEAQRVRRYWQRASVESQTVQASGSLQYRAPAGDYYYVHPDLPGKAFRTRKAAAQAAVR